MKAIVLCGGLGVACACGPTGSSGPQAGAQAVAVETAVASRLGIEQAEEIVGSLGARRAADIRSEYAGVVSEVLVAEWGPVTRGTALARLDVREARAAAESARSAFLQAQVAADRAARELERTSQMKEAGLATQQALDEARAAEQTARSGATAARAQQQAAEARLDKATLRAPIDGVVYARNVNVGDFVDSQGSEPAFRIADLRDLELVASVPSTRGGTLAVGQPVRFETDADAKVEYTGKVSSINPGVEEASRTIKVKVAVPNQEGALRPGQFVRGRIVTGRREGVLVVPRTALASWDPSRGTGAVFVVEGGKARWRAVQTGAVAGGLVEIITGLKAGDTVVTRGAFNLHDGDLVAAAKEG